MSEPEGNSDQSFRDTLYTVDKSGKRRWVYSAIVKGKFFKIRQVIAYVLVCFFLSMPWVTIGGKQGIWLDFAHRKFTFFGATFWATDTLFLVLVLGFLAISLFFFTALFGRVWCGWACPETVFLEFVFRPIDRLIEGNASQRARLDQQAWNFDKIKKKTLKYIIYALLSWVLASTFLAYFIGSEPLVRMMSDWPQNNPGPFALTMCMMGVMLFQFGWFREQFCTVLCPYARFQSVMMDPNSLVVGYDVKRGEPRGKKGAAEGDCVDCKMCVRVCPTGIDIRNGLQLECVNCTQCIDACNSIMDKVGRARGLIRYDTEAKLEGLTSKIIRPRVVIYALILLLYVGAFVYLLGSRQLSDFQVLRTSSDAPFSVVNQDIVMNHFEVRVGNKASEVNKYRFSLPGEPNYELIVPLVPLEVNAGAIQTVPLFVRFPKSDLMEGKKKLTIAIEGEDGFLSQQELTLLGPEN